MNLDELQSVQSKERRNDTLQHLRDSFYDDVGEYVADLKNRRDLAAERADDPFGSPEVRRLTDEIETAEEVVEKVYERRMGKLVKQASLAAAGMNADTEGMTVQERDLFDDIVESIERNKADVLATLSGETADATADPEPDRPPAGRAGTESEVSAASMMAEDGPTRESPTADPTAGAPDPSRAESEPTPSESPASNSTNPPARAATDPASTAGERAPTDETAGRTGDTSASPADLEADPLSQPDDDTDRPPTEAHAVVGDEGDEMTDGGPTVGQAASGGSAGAGTTSTDRAGSGGLGGTAEETERSTVRITDDVGQIFGVDGREYDLERSDVVQLPEQNAEPLLEQDAAERLD